MSLGPWPLLPGWRRRGTSSPRLRRQRRLAWLPWGSAVAVMLGRPSPAGRSQHRRASSAPGGKQQQQQQQRDVKYSASFWRTRSSIRFFSYLYMFIVFVQSAAGLAIFLCSIVC